MRDTLPIEISEVISIILLLASTVSVYINLLSKIQSTESIVKHLMYSIEIIKEKESNHSNNYLQLINETNRLSKQLELSIQQSLSDKDSSLLYKNNLKELIDHKASRWQAEIVSLETDYKQKLADIENEVISQARATEHKVNNLTNFLIKNSNFITRDKS